MTRRFAFIGAALAMLAGRANGQALEPFSFSCSGCGTKFATFDEAHRHLACPRVRSQLTEAYFTYEHTNDTARYLEFGPRGGGALFTLEADGTCKVRMGAEFKGLKIKRVQIEATE
jgi:hypothetical protein